VILKIEDVCCGTAGGNLKTWPYSTSVGFHIDCVLLKPASGDDIYSPGIILNYTLPYRLSGVAASFNKGVFINGVLPALLSCAAVSLSFRPSASLLLRLPIVD
jgi:hypothetical protein